VSASERNARRPAVVCLGDVFGDVIVDLTGTEYEATVGAIVSSTNVFAPIGRDVGGAGVQLAIAARRSGFNSVTLIGKVGFQGGEPDVTAKGVFGVLSTAGVDAIFGLTSEIATGQVVVLYLPGDRRLMVSDPLANQTFTPEDVTDAMLRAVAESDVFHVSGYAWLQESRRKAAIMLMEQAKKSGVPVALDLVPHDIARRIDPGTLLASLDEHVDWLFVELPTAYRLVYGDALPDRGESTVKALMKDLTTKFPVVLLQLSPSEAILEDRGRRRTWGAKYEPGPASRGQSARVHADVLHHLVVSHPPPSAAPHD
jgi:sugar/nucleoside kinase (ribokinase family)